MVGIARRGARALVYLALAASMGANLVLVQSSHHYFAAASALRLDPAGRQVYAAERGQVKPASKPRIVLFGDSRALMWPTPKGLDDFEVVNRGIGNQTTAQILMRVDDDVAPMRPSVVVLEAGVNDLKAIAEFPERRDEIVAGCEENLRRIVERCRATGAEVVVVSVFGIGDVALWRRLFWWSRDVESAVKQVNRFLPNLAGDRVTVLDADPVLDGGRGRINQAYQYDFLHLTPAGYAALDERLLPVLRALPHAERE